MEGAPPASPIGRWSVISSCLSQDCLYTSCNSRGHSEVMVRSWWWRFQRRFQRPQRWPRKCGRGRGAGKAARMQLFCLGRFKKLSAASVQQSHAARVSFHLLPRLGHPGVDLEPGGGAGTLGHLGEVAVGWGVIGTLCHGGCISWPKIGTLGVDICIKWEALRHWCKLCNCNY